MLRTRMAVSCVVEESPKEYNALSMMPAGMIRLPIGEFLTDSSTLIGRRAKGGQAALPETGPSPAAPAPMTRGARACCLGADRKGRRLVHYTSLNDASNSALLLSVVQLMTRPSNGSSNEPSPYSSTMKTLLHRRGGRAERTSSMPRMAMLRRMALADGSMPSSIEGVEGGPEVVDSCGVVGEPGGVCLLGDADLVGVLSPSPRRRDDTGCVNGDPLAQVDQWALEDAAAGGEPDDGGAAALVAGLGASGVHARDNPSAVGAQVRARGEAPTDTLAAVGGWGGVDIAAGTGDAAAIGALGGVDNTAGTGDAAATGGAAAADNDGAAANDVLPILKSNDLRTSVIGSSETATAPGMHT